MNKRKISDILFTLILVSFIITSISGFLYYQDVVSTFSIPNIKYSPKGDQKSYILDKDKNLVQEIPIKKEYQVNYEDLPDIFINALISAEDSTFFEHNGFDVKRIFGAILANLGENKLQGASTLTQQLIKNLLLSNEKSLERKINEIILATRFEKEYTKEEILTIYVNEISFEGTKNGINYAANRFFNKNINDVTLPEAALLAGLVKSPTKYNPFNSLENANERKNVVLSLMKRHGYINQTQYLLAINKKVEDMLYRKGNSDVSYDYQSYLDVVYEEVKKRFGLDPYTTPMIIETYLNPQIQHSIDIIQKNEDEEIKFIDEYQQIGGVLLDNDNISIIGVIGGRNYQGIKLYNRACDMKQQPASTIKPLLSYALAYEYLNWSSQHVVEDFPLTYPGTNIDIKNVDSRYMGEITIEDAIGFSRNTSAVSTLNKVANKIGMSRVGMYLDSLNLLDYESYNIPYSYALGGFLNGVTPLYLASAYAMLANYGIYQEPTAIKKITLLENNKTLFIERDKKRVLSEESGFLITNTLVNVAKKNYWSIGNGAPKNVTIGAKTGTSNFAYETLKKLNYPLDSNKDIWYAGYSPDYTCVVWTGFDQHLANENTRFANKNDTRVRVSRQIFKKLVGQAAKPKLQFSIPSGIVERNIVKGIYPYVLASEIIPSSLNVKAYFKKGYEPSIFYNIPPLPSIDNINLYLIVNDLEIHMPILEQQKSENKIIYNDYMVTGDILYCVDVFINDEIYTYESKKNIITIPYDDYINLTIKAYYKYEKLPNITSQKYNVTITS